MSQRPENSDSTEFRPGDADDQPTRRDAPGHLNVAGTSGQTIGDPTTGGGPVGGEPGGGPTIGGEPAMPGTEEYRQEVENTANTPFGISAGLLWTVGIFAIVAIVLIFVFAL